MPTITLTTVWINDATNPSDFIDLPSMTQLTVTPSVEGEVRRMANGRLRAVQKSGLSNNISLSAPYADRADIDWLVARIGQVVCVRDDRGRKVFAVYFAVPVDEARTRVEYGSIQLNLQEVTFDEAS